MNKTSIVHELPCGCVERRWLFGGEALARCAAHRREPVEQRHVRFMERHARRMARVDEALRKVRNP